jgi:hypothetical protein
MENKDFIIEEEVLVKIGQYEEVPYRMVCYDGYAEGTLIDDDAEFPNAPKTIRMEYLTLDEVLSDKGGIADDILFYRGLWDKQHDNIHYGDIMMYLGEIVPIE